MTHHKALSKRARIALALVCVATVILFATGLVVRSCIKCDEFVENPIWSPDGKWAVQAKTRACPAGLLLVTLYDVFVTLAPKSSAASGTDAPVLVFENDGSAEPPSITWVSANEVIFRVSEVGTVKISKRVLQDVAIRYVIQKRMWNSLANIDNDRLRDAMRS